MVRVPLRRPLILKSKFYTVLGVSAAKRFLKGYTVLDCELSCKVTPTLSVLQHERQFGEVFADFDKRSLRRRPRCVEIKLVAEWIGRVSVSTEFPLLTFNVSEVPLGSPMRDSPIPPIRHNGLLLRFTRQGENRVHFRFFIVGFRVVRLK